MNITEHLSSRTYSFPLPSGSFELNQLVCIKKATDGCEKLGFLSISGWDQKKDLNDFELRLYLVSGELSDVPKIAEKKRRDSEVFVVNADHYYFSLTGYVAVGSVLDIQVRMVVRTY